MIASVVSIGWLGVLVQRVRRVTLIGTNRALDGGVVEDDLVGHGAGEMEISAISEEVVIQIYSA